MVRFSVHDVARLRTRSLHRCYRMQLPYNIAISSVAAAGLFAEHGLECVLFRSLHICLDIELIIRGIPV